MITKNGKKLFGTFTGAQFYLKLINGQTSGWTDYKYNWFNNNNIIVGSGNTMPTTSDYCLESQIDTLTKVSESHTQPSSYSSYMYTIQATFKNNTDANITVKEIGVKVGANTEYMSLIIREVLDAPVVIKPQKSYTFSITI